MKISRKTIRRIIREEIKRDLPLAYYSDEMLMQEGLFDWLSDLFGKFVGFFTGEAEGGVGSAQTTLATVDDNVADAAEEAGIEDVNSADDLDMNDKKHQKIFYAALVPVEKEWAKNANDVLKSAAAIEDWTPKSDSDEDAKVWQDENGKSAGELWSVIGNYQGGQSWYGEKGLSAAGKSGAAGDVAIKSGNPGEGVKWLVSAFGSQKDIWEFADGAGVDGAKDIAGMMDTLIGQAEELGKVIAKSSEEQQKESIELRKLINGLILQERSRNT